MSKPRYVYVLKDDGHYLAHASPTGKLDEWGGVQSEAVRFTREQARKAVEVRVGFGYSLPRVVRLRSTSARPSDE